MIPASPRSVPNIDAAIAFARHMLHVQPGTEQDERLQRAARELAVETPEGVTPEGVTLRQQAPRPMGVVWWRPSR